MRKTPIWLGVLALCGLALGQTSTSFTLEEYTFNAGGHPTAGAVMASTSFTITFDALGDGLAPGKSGSDAFNLDGGFVGSYPPPGEVLQLLFTDKTTLVWDPEESAGTYNLYRDLNSNLTGLGFGACEQQALASATTTDNEAVPANDGYFYLVTVENRLAEEGTKGFRTGMIERQGTFCP